jgi:hypothetical protein
MSQLPIEPAPEPLPMADYCCEQWWSFPSGSKTWAWHVMHRLSHSRVPFSVATVATLAQETTERARELIADAITFAWIEGTPGGKPSPIYVGVLKP